MPENKAQGCENEIRGRSMRRVEELGMRRNIEILSTVCIGLCVMFGGRAILATLTQFAGIASFLLFLIACVQGWRLVQTLKKKDEVARLAASRDITALAAALFAIIAVLVKASWSIGATIASVEFVIVLEVMRIVTAARLQSEQTD
jgi:amino acid transporter